MHVEHLDCIDVLPTHDGHALAHMISPAFTRTLPTHDRQALARMLIRAGVSDASLCLILGMRGARYLQYL